MRRIGFFVALSCLIGFGSPLKSNAQRNCGQGIIFKEMAASNPGQLEQLRAQHQQMIDQAMNNPVAAKTTATYPIPVAFHFVLTTANYYALGGDTGIKRRVNSQIACLNRDFGGANTDKSKVPTPFK